MKKTNILNSAVLSLGMLFSGCGGAPQKPEKPKLETTFKHHTGAWPENDAAILIKPVDDKAFIEFPLAYYEEDSERVLTLLNSKWLQRAAVNQQAFVPNKHDNFRHNISIQVTVCKENPGMVSAFLSEAVNRCHQDMSATYCLRKDKDGKIVFIEDHHGDGTPDRKFEFQP